MHNELCVKTYIFFFFNISFIVLRDNHGLISYHFYVVIVGLDDIPMFINVDKKIIGI